MTDIILIPVNDENLIKITKSLAEEIWNEHYIPIIGKNQVDYMLNKFQSEETISSQIKEGCFYYLIKHKEDYAGYFSYSFKKENLFLSKIYLKSECRGNGIGKKAFGFLGKTAIENNLSEITLTVNKNNVNSIKAYEKFGFIIIDSVVQDIGSGFFMDDYLMKKPIFN